MGPPSEAKVQARGYVTRSELLVVTRKGSRVLGQVDFCDAIYDATVHLHLEKQICPLSKPRDCLHLYLSGSTRILQMTYSPSEASVLGFQQELALVPGFEHFPARQSMSHLQDLTRDIMARQLVKNERSENIDRVTNPSTAEPKVPGQTITSRRPNAGTKLKLAKVLPRCNDS